MYATRYHRPSTIDEAAAALAAAEDGRLLAGGQTLLPTLKQHLAAPTDLIDIRRIAGLSGISVTGRMLAIGAATTHAEVARSADVASLVPALNTLAGGIGDPAVRNLGTIGGSVANSDPAADYPAALLGLGATIVTNGREIAADDFFTGLFSTALERSEIVTSVKIEAPVKAAYAKFPNPASLYAMVGVFVADTGRGIRVAVTGAGEDGVFRHAGLEAALAANWSPGALDPVEVSPEGLLADLHASAEYRAHLIRVMARRAVAAA